MSNDPARRGIDGPYMPDGLPIPVASEDGLDTEHWDGLKRHQLLVQRCTPCGAYQWGPEWICHACHSFDVGWAAVSGEGRIYTWERAWHPVHPALKDACPYLTVVVELPDADNVRLVGNLVGDPMHPISIGDEVQAVFEDHPNATPPHTLLQWRRRA